MNPEKYTEEERLHKRLKVSLTKRKLQEHSSGYYIGINGYTRKYTQLSRQEIR